MFSTTCLLRWCVPGPGAPGRIKRVMRNKDARGTRKPGCGANTGRAGRRAGRRTGRQAGTHILPRTAAPVSPAATRMSARSAMRASSPRPERCAEAPDPDHCFPRRPRAERCFLPGCGADHGRTLLPIPVRCKPECHGKRARAFAHVNIARRLGGAARQTGQMPESTSCTAGDTVAPALTIAPVHHHPDKPNGAEARAGWHSRRVLGGVPASPSSLPSLTLEG